MNHRSILPITVQNLAGGVGSHLRILRHGSEAERRVTRRCLKLLPRVGTINLLSGMFGALDHALYPAFTRVRPTAPVFVVAPARSGTTLLYELLASDPQFVGPALYKTIFPALSLQRAIRAIGSRLGEERSREVFSKMHRDLEEADGVHRTRMNELEEDSPFFGMRFASPTSIRFFPYWSGIQQRARLDDCSPAARRRVMNRYYGMIQRTLYEHPGRTYLAKSVCSAGRIASLLERFPDARMIHIVRHPFKVIPSALHMHWVMGHIGVEPALRPPLGPGVFCHELFEAMIFTYQRLLEWERRLSADRWLTLRFDQLIADPRSAVDRVYERFGLTRSPAAARALDRAIERSPRHRARVRPPTLATFGLTRAYVRSRLHEVFAAYELDPVLGGDRE